MQIGSAMEARLLCNRERNQMLERLPAHGEAVEMKFKWCSIRQNLPYTLIVNRVMKNLRLSA